MIKPKMIKHKLITLSLHNSQDNLINVFHKLFFFLHNRMLVLSYQSYTLGHKC